MTLPLASKVYQDANDAFIEEDYETAIDLYTQTLEFFFKAKVEVAPLSQILSKRAMAYIKLENYDAAIKDALDCIQLGDSVGLSKGYLRKGIAEFHLKKKEDAKNSFLKCHQYNPNEKGLNIWLKKCGVSMEEKEKNLSATEESQVQNLNNPVEVFAKNSTEASHSNNLKPCVEKPVIRHEWYQNDHFVIITIFIKNVKENDVDIQFMEQSLSVSVQMPNGANYSLELDPLFNVIVPKNSTYLLLSTKIEIKLAKKMTSLRWSSLEGNTTPVSNSASGTTPSSKEKNWDKLAKDLVNEEEEKPTGDAALNQLFQQIYRDASDETRKAMIKSFQESAGTCLSTNWEEVKKDKVKITPPEGMEARKRFKTGKLIPSKQT